MYDTKAIQTVSITVHGYNIDELDVGRLSTTQYADNKQHMNSAREKQTSVLTHLYRSIDIKTCQCVRWILMVFTIEFTWN